MDNLRRICVDRLTPAELAIYNATIAVEAVGAHPLLTDAVILLGQARDKVANFVDSQPNIKSIPVAEADRILDEADYLELNMSDKEKLNALIRATGIKYDSIDHSDKAEAVGIE